MIIQEQLSLFSDYVIVMYHIYNYLISGLVTCAFFIIFVFQTHHVFKEAFISLKLLNVIG